MAFSDHPRLTVPSMSVRFAQNTVSVCGSFTTGSNMALSQRRNESRMRHMPFQSTTVSIDTCENGSPTQVISIQHPQRKLYEVHYAKGVVIPRRRAGDKPVAGIGPSNNASFFVSRDRRTAAGAFYSARLVPLFVAQGCAI